MSLRAFHVFFVLVCVLFLLGFAAWGVLDYTHTGSVTNLALGIVSMAGCALLATYGRWFLKKLRERPELA